MNYKNIKENYKKIKEICNRLERANCYFRHPKTDFIKVLGQERVDEMLSHGWLKNSPQLAQAWADFSEPCYEFGNLFRRVFNFFVTPKWLWFKVYVLQFWRVKIWWQKLMIKCGKHYTWQEYEGVNLDEI